MSDKEFIQKYLNDFSSLVKPSDNITEKIIKSKNILIEANKNNKKIMIFGNGGSAAIASHFSVDLTKNAKVTIRVSLNKKPNTRTFNRSFITRSFKLRF